MSQLFLHDHPQFEQLLRIVADAERIDPVLVEKDYWIMHVLWGLRRQYEFALKGGTSLSKGSKVIDRFSEDIDILIYPPTIPGLKVDVAGEKRKAIESRRSYFEWLTSDIDIPGIVKAVRDPEFDDQKFRSGGIRLYYNQLFGSLEGVKDGILLEAGFSQVAPNSPKLISSWAYERAAATSGVTITDNRALEVPCYHIGYCFVEKLQTIVRHFRQEISDGTRKKNFMRQYYDVYSLLGQDEVIAFIGSEEYENHKKAWIRGADAEIALNEHPALMLSDADRFNDYQARYVLTKSLYYRRQVPFSEIIDRIRAHVHLL